MDDWFDKQEDRFNRHPMGWIISTGFKVCFALAILGVGASWLGLFATAVTTPAAIVKKVIEPNNILYNYEWFYDVNAQYIARSAQLTAWNKEYVSEKDDNERRKLRIEVQAVSQSCRNLVTSYNANSEKMNREIFKGWSLPANLSIEACEAKS